MRYAPEDDDWAKLDDGEVDFPQPSDLVPYEHLLNSLLALQDKVGFPVILISQVVLVAYLMSIGFA